MIYLDNNASTSLDNAVREAMDSAADLYGNPSSVHSAGRRARRAVEEARSDVAALVGAEPDEVFFTSGGTEANALAIFGSTAGRKGRIVTTAVEHPSVREPLARLAEAGGLETVAIRPEPTGELDPAKFLDATGSGAVLVSVMAANNEYGALFPVADLGPRLRERGIVVHSDAVQAAGKVPVDVRAWDVDLLTISAHKLHGPKGVGALFVRRGVRLLAHTPGGGQEKKLRPGTENTVGIVGFGVAARLARGRLAVEGPRIASRRDRLEQGILEAIPGTRAVGGSIPRTPNTSTILFDGVPGDALLFRLDLEGVAVSVGSACSSGTLSPSPAILALGFSAEQAKGVVRFSLSRSTTDEEIDRVLALLPRVVSDARAARRSPALAAQ
jgi:cysteine desulfurase